MDGPATPELGPGASPVPLPIYGSGFVSGAAVSAGAGVTVRNVAFVSSTRVTATFAIDSGATGGPRGVTVTNPNGSGGTLPNGFTVNVPVPATVTLAYKGAMGAKGGGVQPSSVGAVLSKRE